jgi:hypothetical protein
MQSTSENDFECFASTGMNAPENTIFEYSKVYIDRPATNA